MAANSVESQKVILSIVGSTIDGLICAHGEQLPQSVNDRLEETIATVVEELEKL